MSTRGLGKSVWLDHRPAGNGPDVRNPYKVAAGITTIVLAMIVGLWLLVVLRGFVLIVVVAALLAAALDRPVCWVQSHLRLPRRGYAVAVVCLLALGVLIGFGYLIYEPFLHQSKVFQQGLPPLMNRVKQLPLVGPRLRHVDLVGETQQFLQEIPKWVTRHRDMILGVAQTALTSIVLTFTTIAIAIFMLLQGPRLADRSLDLILDGFRRERARRLGRNVLDSVAGYVNGNLLISLLAATVTAVALLLMRVPFIGVLAAVMFVLDLIPLVGATLGGTVVTAATFVLDPHPWKALVFAGFFLVYQEVESHTLYPMIMGRKVKIGSFGVFLVTLAGGELGGILGAFLAIPVGAAISVIVKDVIEERRNKALAVAASTTRLELARVGGARAEARPDTRPDSRADPGPDARGEAGEPRLIVAEPDA
jgi:predicted PurR-regulated permease PerM